MLQPHIFLGKLALQVAYSQLIGDPG